MSVFHQVKNRPAIKAITDVVRPRGRPLPFTQSRPHSDLQPLAYVQCRLNVTDGLCRNNMYYLSLHFFGLVSVCLGVERLHAGQRLQKHRVPQPARLWLVSHVKLRTHSLDLSQTSIPASLPRRA